MKSVIGLFLVAISSPVFSKGISPYLPIALSPEVELQIDRVMALTPATPLTKPYKTVDLLERLDLIKQSHPVLYTTLSKYLDRYKQTGLTHGAIKLSGSSGDGEVATSVNGRGIPLHSNYQIELGAITYLGPYMYASGGFIYDDVNNLTHHNTHVAVGNQYIQMELGYREHWFSPFKDSAMLVSTHAAPSESITISNATPYTAWDIRFEMFYSQLEEVEQIVLGDETFPGRPRHAGLHLSFSPFDFWTIGLNRTLQFGGGKRSVDVGDVFEALFDPAGKDNVGDANNDDPNFEFGNQQASVTTQFNFDLGMPVSIYAEYAGEDTVDESNFKLGNDSKALGIYLPILSDNISMRYEVTHWADRWYVHHLYPAGYTNDGTIMGHWGGSRRLSSDAIPATAHSMNVMWQFTQDQLVDVTLRTVNNDGSNRAEYERSVEADIRYSFANRYGFWGATLTSGKDTFGESYTRLTGFYRW
ncbi:capsule assembly Wzi family protein [Aestuariibacter sp. AA17]|uniref:Capsule assembly Wzi family protein n=1 Tax=Fluctibacter corallii TaxID=2984329 RepID=A0ABT3ABX3_9ALTE|nr:capsule assembly Wzi family protein [Aestuariibacter sp. AA17]MCV2886158.1 capsule assembly Wzi family protein [Aestuariibacter sp. AA17]